LPWRRLRLRGMAVLAVALAHRANGAKGLVALAAVALAFLLIGRRN
jgi:hypothetical protein